MYYSTGLLLSGSLFATVLVAKKDDQDTVKENKADHKSELIMVIKRGKLAEQRQQIDEAEKLYHEALDLITYYSNQMHIGWSKEDLLQARVYVYDCMANLAMFNSQFDKAVSLYKETMRGLLQQGHSQNSDAIVELSLKLSMIYTMQGKLTDAKQGYEFCIKTQEDKLNAMEERRQDIDDNTIAILGLTLDSYSKFLIFQSKLPEALETVKKAIDIAEKVFGLLHPQLAVLYNDMATIQSMMKSYTAATDSVINAIDIAKKTDSSDLPVFVANLGAIYIHKNELTMAEKHCKRAVYLSQKLSNEEAKSQAEKCLSEIRTLLKEKKNAGK